MVSFSELVKNMERLWEKSAPEEWICILALLSHLPIIGWPEMRQCNAPRHIPATREG